MAKVEYVGTVYRTLREWLGRQKYKLHLAMQVCQSGLNSLNPSEKPDMRRRQKNYSEARETTSLQDTVQQHKQETLPRQGTK